MNDGTLRRIAWRQVLPWILLFQTPRLAARLPVMCLAFAAVMISPFGWQLAKWLFLDPSLQANPRGPEAWPGINVGAQNHNVDSLISTAFSYGPDAFRAQVANWKMMLSNQTNTRGLAYFAMGSLWSLCVWSFFGAAICRISVAHLGCGDRVGLSAAVRFARKRFAAVVAAPLMPFCALLLIALIPAALGWLMSLGFAGAILGAILWGASWIAGILMTLLALGVFFGWPLMTPTIAAERNGDSFEALSRAYAYCTQRPLHLFLYAGLASILGGAAWVLVDAFFGFLLYSTLLAATWAGAEQADLALANSLTQSTANADAHVRIVRFWIVLLRGFASGFHFSFFWAAASAIYLLLRRDVDETDFDEVDLDDDSDPLPMPKISPTPIQESMPSDDSHEEGSNDKGAGSTATSANDADSANESSPVIDEGQETSGDDEGTDDPRR